MLRQVSSRNQRGKGGVKMKNALHICLFVAICVWLLYQMKHSHDKKKAFDERDSKVSFKGNDKLLDITKVGRKDLSHTVEMKSTGKARIEEEERNDAERVEHGIRHEAAEDDEEEGGSGDHEMDEQDQEGSVHEEEEVAHEEGKKGQAKEVDRTLEDREHDEASHEAREISFRGDDASSEVAHIIQHEVEREEVSQEARERSFKADDASSAVAHVPQVSEPAENGGTRNLDENESENAERKDGEISTVANETLQDSSATKLLHDYVGNTATVVPEGSETLHNNTVIKRVGAPILENVSPQNTTTTTGKSEHHKEQQPDPRIESVISNQTEREMPTNSTSSSKYQIYFQKNSTTVSVDLIGAEANLTVKVDPTNATVLQNQTTTIHAIDGQINTVKLETRGEDKPNLEKTVMQQKADTIAKTTSTATNDDLSKLPDIQNRVHSGDVIGSA